jgi:hypothetical protein
MEAQSQELSSASKAILEKANALKILKDALGPLWEDQKKQLLEQYISQVGS